MPDAGFRCFFVQDAEHRFLRLGSEVHKRCYRLKGILSACSQGLRQRLTSPLVFEPAQPLDRCLAHLEVGSLEEFQKNWNVVSGSIGGR